MRKKTEKLPVIEAGWRMRGKLETGWKEVDVSEGIVVRTLYLWISVMNNFITSGKRAKHKGYPICSYGGRKMIWVEAGYPRDSTFFTLSKVMGNTISILICLFYLNWLLIHFSLIPSWTEIAEQEKVLWRCPRVLQCFCFDVVNLFGEVIFFYFFVKMLCI